MAEKGEKEEKVDYQKRTVELLEELVKWTKFSSLPHVKQVLLELLPTDENKIAYHSSDGRNSDEVARLAGAGATSVQRWWKSWIKNNIAEPIKVQRGDRAKRLFDLEDFGINVPAPKIIKTNKQDESSIPDSEGQREKKDE